MCTNTFPNRFNDRIETFDTVGSGSLGQGGQTQGCDCPDLLLVVHQPVLDDFNQRPEMGQDGATTKLVLKAPKII